MLSMRISRSSLFLVALLAVICGIVPVASADIIQSSPSMPPQGGAYTAPPVCVQLGIGSGVCVVNPALYGFNGTTRSIDLSGESIDSNILFSASVYTNVGGHPGAFLAPLNASGPIGIFYAGRTSDSEEGTFMSSLTELDLTGTFNAGMLGTHSLEVTLGPMTSSGPTTISPWGSDFRISSFFDVFAEISIDGGPPMAGPMRTFTLQPVPEPGTVSLMALGLLGVTAGDLRRRLLGKLSR